MTGQLALFIRFRYFLRSGLQYEVILVTKAEVESRSDHWGKQIGAMQSVRASPEKSIRNRYVITTLSVCLGLGWGERTQA